MNVTTVIQQMLDNVLLPFGVLSNHLRRVKTDSIENMQVKVNNNEYVVYRVVSNTPKTYGDGNALTRRVYIDVNYYYKYEKTDPRYSAVDDRLKAIKRAIIADPHFRIANDETDIPDTDNPYRGVNIEFVYVGAVDYGK